MCLTSPPPKKNKFVAKKIGLSDVRTICNEAPSDLFIITLLSSQSLREGFLKKNQIHGWGGGTPNPSK